ncbi:MAG: S41 family peptidase [Vagococcus sp.]
MKETNKGQITLFQYVLTIILVAVVASGTTLFIYEWRGTSASTSLSMVGNDDDLDSVAYLNELIQSKYVGKVDQQALIDGALKGMTDAIGDPHSTYFSASEAKEFDSSVSGSFEGIGAVMKLENEYPTIAEPPIKDSPAEKAKLKAGDVIIKVDGKETKGKALSEVVKTVRGEKGSKVTLDIGRGEDTFPVEITRDTIPVESVKGNIDKNNKTIGAIKIMSFNDTTSTEFDTVVTQLRKEGATSFILDVRGNPGGVLTEVEKMTSRFLKDGQTIVAFEDKDKSKQTDVASKSLDQGHKITEPTVLLVDENSASASEIMAGAFKAAKLDVIGTKTYGKGTVQTLIPLGQDGELKLTIKKWLTPDGKWINEKGVEPTIKVDYPSYLKNPIIDTSLEYKEGVINKNVKILNDYLNVLGYLDGEVNDVYSPETSVAMSKLQKTHGLDENGQANKETIKQLELDIIEYWDTHDVQYNKGIDQLKK